MPQEIRVLCCSKCKMFQVDIVKKSNKWQCKMCHEKQSVFREFFRGSGAECRLKVQELNLNANAEVNKIEAEFLDLLDRDDLDIDLESIVKENTKSHNCQPKAEDSKWSKYVETRQDDEDLDFPEPPSKMKKSINQTSDEPIMTFGPNGSKWDKYL